MIESLQIYAIVYVFIILNHVGIKMIFPCIEGSCMVYRPITVLKTKLSLNTIPY